MTIKNPTIIIKNQTDNNQSSSQSSIELNISCESTTPSNTSKLWIPNQNFTKATISNKELKSLTFSTTENIFSSMLYRSGSCKVNNSFYIFGGNTSSTTYTNKIFKYDILTETMTTLNAVLPNAMSYMGCALVNNKIYLLGGTNGTVNFNTILIFDVETETITTSNAVLPYYIYRTSCVTYNNEIYLFGGKAQTTNTYSAAHAIDIVQKFNPQTLTTSTISSNLSLFFSNAGVIRIDDKVYILGGCYNTPASNYSIYSLTSNTILATYPLLHNTYGPHSANLIGTDIYIPYENWFLKIDTLTNQNEVVYDLPYVIAGCSTFYNENNKTIYIFGGVNLSSVAKFDFRQKLNNNEIFIKTDDSKNLIKILDNTNLKLECGIDKVYKGNTLNNAEQITAKRYDTSTSTWIEI